MSFLLFVGLVALVYYLVTRNSNNSAPTVSDKLEERNREWAQYLIGFRKKAKNKSQQDFLEEILDDVRAKGLPVPLDSNLKANVHTGQFTPDDKIDLNSTEPKLAFESVSPAPTKTSEPMDNTTLLLYFGAFLFVASVGLFVAFGKAGGLLRTMAVIMVTLVLYSGGIWLYRNKPKLKPAGLAFAGIGIAIMPLVGLAAYNYLFVGQAEKVWFITSLLSMALYAHALVTIRKPLINYIFIFTFLSLFESGVSIASAPIYYFGWAMALVGMVLQLVSKWKGFWPELQESSRNSGQLFLPLAVFVSLFLVTTQGTGQLGVSLLLAALFYGLETLNTSGQDKQTNAIASQLAIIAGVGCLVYAFTNETSTAALSLAVMSIIQMFGLWVFKTPSGFSYNFANILFMTSLASILLAIGTPNLVFSNLVIFIVVGFAIWLRQNREDAYSIAISTMTFLPVVYGQYVLSPRLGIFDQTKLLFVTLLLHIAIYLTYKLRSNSENWLKTAQSTYLISVITIIAFGLFNTPAMSLVFTILAGTTTLVLSLIDDRKVWAPSTGLLVAAPLLVSWQEPKVFLWTSVIALGTNIFLALWCREEFNRWASSLLWLLLPISCGHFNVFAVWQAESYAYAYLVAMFGLLLSRAIARGSVFISSKVPLASYAKTASQSYVYGYVTAGILALVISLFADASQTHTTLISLVLLATVALLTVRIEKRPDITAIIPLLAQFSLWSALRPSAGNDLNSFLILSSILAASFYALSQFLPGNDQKNTHAYYFKSASLITSFIAPSSILFVTNTAWPMPAGLALSGFLLYDYFADTSQDNREMAGGVIVASMMWFLFYWGVRNPQVYSHVVVATFAGYAYWRTTRGENKQADNYLQLMLATATIPLALQAIAGQSGGVYGWWLLLEEIAFMLLGMAIRKRFVIFWGLYVAVAAVLYQLRNLGWAALTVLALFLIGIAIYQLQRHSDKN